MRKNKAGIIHLLPLLVVGVVVVVIGVVVFSTIKPENQKVKPTQESEKDIEICSFQNGCPEEFCQIEPFLFAMGPTTTGIDEVCVPKKEIDIEKLPALFSDLNWEKPKESFHQYFIQKIDNRSESAHPVLTGKRWTASKKNLTSQEKNSLDLGFITYYISQFDSLSWRNDWQHSGYKFTGGYAESPAGSSVTNVIIYEEKLRLAHWSYNIEFQDGELSYTHDCPCDIQFSYFVSDPISVQDLIDQTYEK